MRDEHVSVGLGLCGGQATRGEQDGDKGVNWYH